MFHNIYLFTIRSSSTVMCWCFHWLGPLGRVGHRVTMFVCLFVPTQNYYLWRSKKCLVKGPSTAFGQWWHNLQKNFSFYVCLIALFLSIKIVVNQSKSKPKSWVFLCECLLHPEIPEKFQRSSMIFVFLIISFFVCSFVCTPVCPSHKKIP